MDNINFYEMKTDIFSYMFSWPTNVNPVLRTVINKRNLPSQFSFQLKFTIKYNTNTKARAIFKLQKARVFMPKLPKLSKKKHYTHQYYQ